MLATGGRQAPFLCLPALPCRPLLLPSQGSGCPSRSALSVLSFLLGNYNLLGFNYWSPRTTTSLPSETA